MLLSAELSEDAALICAAVSVTSHLLQRKANLETDERARSVAGPATCRNLGCSLRKRGGAWRHLCVSLSVMQSHVIVLSRFLLEF